MQATSTLPFPPSGAIPNHFSMKSIRLLTYPLWMCYRLVWAYWTTWPVVCEYESIVSSQKSVSQAFPLGECPARRPCICTLANGQSKHASRSVVRIDLISFQGRHCFRAVKPRNASPIHTRRPGIVQRGGNSLDALGQPPVDCLPKPFPDWNSDFFPYSASKCSETFLQ